MPLVHVGGSVYNTSIWIFGTVLSVGLKLILQHVVLLNGLRASQVSVRMLGQIPGHRNIWITDRQDLVTHVQLHEHFWSSERRTTSGV